MQVEDGTLIANADSYASVEFADAYNAARGNDAWAGFDTEAKTQALIRATDHIERVYRSAWRGVTVSDAQSLAWPRMGVPHPERLETFLPSTLIPRDLQRAVVELATRIASGVDIEPDVTGPRVTSEKVDVISVTYDTNSPAGPRFPVVDRLLKPYLKPSAYSGGASARLIRS